MSSPASSIVRCPGCQSVMAVDPAEINNPIQCRNCGLTFTAPQAARQSAAPQAPRHPAEDDEHWDFSSAMASDVQGAQRGAQTTPPSSTAWDRPSSGNREAPDAGRGYTSDQRQDPEPSDRHREAQPSGGYRQARTGSQDRNRSTLKLSHDIPAILRQSEKAAGVTNALIGGIGGFVVGLALGILGGKSSLGKVFDLHQITTVIPIGILCLFGWGVMICIYRMRKLKALESVMQPEQMEALVGSLSADGVESQAQALGNYPICDYHPFYRQTRAVLDQWLQRASLQNADLILQKHETIDSDAVQSGYGLVRTFVWAMPVLGLIGTVIGISIAVGGFATFLNGSGSNDVNVIKTSLVSVTSGLSFAFLITLEGLLGALLIMLPSTSLQSREQDALSRIQSFMADDYLPMLMKVMPEEDSNEGKDRLIDESMPGGELMQIWRDAMARVSNETMKAIRASADEMITDLKTYRETNRREVDTVVAKISESIDSISRQSSKTTDDFIARVDILRETMLDDRKAFQTAEREAWERQGAQHRDLIAELKTQHDRFQETTKAVGELVDVSSTALKSQEVVVQSLEHIGNLNVSGLADVINRYAQVLSAAQSGAEANTRDMQAVLLAQRDLQHAVAQLQDLNFMGTMSELRDVIQKITPLLKMLAKPQLVLMSTGDEA